ncbi:MAG: hypothetical protein JRJ68_03240 [Deltaproteobacteria bacterium]|nr:hypothetical protein [Deltaproteobacteria bacterium]
MEVRKTYSKNDDIDLKGVNRLKLQQEIIDSGLFPAYGSISEKGDSVELLGSAEIPSENMAALNALVKVHDPYDMAKHKEECYGKVDKRTAELISNGFMFDGKTFSLSIYAQNNWNTIHDNKADFTFPFEITTKDNDIYDLNEVDVDSFWNTAVGTVATHWGTGRGLKKQIFDAQTKEAIDAVTDNR